ncbi:MAG: 30S ribosomal protein S9 [Mycoplasmataceae bacterium]|jgi:small subunit ribosomal protein S9|nr:30S ribosomal protein S9 [Mycoplasmataceae bacterium]
MAEKNYKGLGRRKSSVARVIITPITAKTNSILINGKTPSQYFPNKIIIQDMEQPLSLLNEKIGSFDVKAKVEGGGFTGQAGAIRLAISRALISYNDELKPDLKKNKLITRDRRVKERKKFGKYGARRSPQFVKR